MPDATAAPVRVWDLPTRLFHWALAICVIGAIITAHVGGDAMTWHFRLGYTIFALLAFRLVWGFVGGHWSRFANFVSSPGAALRYLRSGSGASGAPAVGHNPLGAWSVLGMLGLLIAQVGTGLVSDDEISNSGPLARFVSGGTTELATGYHADIGQWIIVALIVLHVAAIVVYRLRGENLVQPMLTGDKALPASTPASSDGWGPRLLALVLIVLAGVGVRWIVGLGG